MRDTSAARAVGPNAGRLCAAPDFSMLMIARDFWFSLCVCFSPHKQQQQPQQQRLSVSSDMMPYRNDHHSNGYASGTNSINNVMYFGTKIDTWNVLNKNEKFISRARPGWQLHVWRQWKISTRQLKWESVRQLCIQSWCASYCFEKQKRLIPSQSLF